MRHITRNTEPFNSTPLWQAARKRDFRHLSFAERRIAERYGVEPHTARLLATHAYASKGRHA